ncbi:hypothetical protein ACTWQB_08805 [Piscibacillus sp. B03]
MSAVAQIYGRGGSFQWQYSIYAKTTVKAINLTGLITPTFT